MHEKKLSSALLGKSISKERKPLNLTEDSLLEHSLLGKSRDTNSKLPGYSSTTNKGFAGIFGNSSMADYSSNIKKSKNMNIIEASFGIN
jgi:hypothetical protein